MIRRERFRKLPSPREAQKMDVHAVSLQLAMDGILGLTAWPGRLQHGRERGDPRRRLVKVKGVCMNTTPRWKLSGTWRSAWGPCTGRIKQGKEPRREEQRQPVGLRGVCSFPCSFSLLKNTRGAGTQWKWKKRSKCRLGFHIKYGIFKPYKTRFPTLRS